MHGSPEVLTPHPNRDTGCISAEDVDNGTLISKNIGDMLILGCNSGHFDHRYSSIANRFLVNNNVNSVIASDGTVTSRSVFGNYKSKGNPSFVKYLWSAHKYRDNFGFIQYTKNEKGELEYSIIGKKVSAKSIFKALGKDV